ncbi:WecB/TagA/CpsF family glycosyltransferase [Peteryoungia desertarenae]|uniref:WecB/TagA/CpsF family glycosyltransferase n=1 Tax=Peteryoungia desertarenae TaxID=1813451 RepID=A0ABX6QM40_9HYPH|nr:WecB/TagA/CpsF family glycosyltransferase [Peteryoungia desertarenae]QLF69391.1 WecB/TagA/CpsF family glycosyltransferase [Peteryoungia desertarenae]
MNAISHAWPKASAKTILGIPVHDWNWSEALAAVETMLQGTRRFTHFAFLNANNANIMVQDPEYRRVLERCVVLPDGIGVDIASQFIHGKRFTANLNGTDFVPALLTFVVRPLRVGLIGGSADVLAQAAANFKLHTPWHEFIPVADGYFDSKGGETILANLAEQPVDLLLVAMGTPRQEKWIDRHVTADHARVVIGVGALFDFVSGRVPRAPVWIRQIRAEWFYRLWLEPSRLWRRYVLGIPVFLFYILRDRMTNPVARPT